MIKKLISFVTVLSMLTSYGVAFAKTGQTEETTLFELNEAAEATLTGDAKIIAEGNCGISDDNATWTLTSDGVLTISGSGEMANYDTPPWYDYKNNIKEAVINDGITKIGNYAFYDCTSLISVTIPEGVMAIGNGAFYDCTSLISVTIPESVATMGDHVFSACTSLSSITVDYNNANYKSIDGVLFSKDGTELIQYPTGNTQTSYNIPEGVITIYYDAFAYCESLSSVTIPEGVMTIGDYAFYDCTSLSSITIPASVTKIGDYIFDQCSPDLEISGYTGSVAESYAKENNIKFKLVGEISTKVLDEGNCGINGDNAKWTFTNTGVLTISGSGEIEDYDTPPWNNYIENINEIVIGAGITSVPYSVFYYCSSFSSITVDDNNANYKSIDGVLFSKDGTTLIQYPIGNKQTSYNIPESVTTIDNMAFNLCKSFSSITIPKSVTTIGGNIFTGCESLSSITVDENNANYKSIDGILFSKDEKKLIIYPLGKKQTSYVIPDGVTEIGLDAFAYCSSLSSITIPESVMAIGSRAFRNCSSLSSITIPKSVTEIGNYTFHLCTSLSSITIPESVMAIGDGAFRSCSSLSSITIPASVTEIGWGAFSNCESLSSITIPASVTEIGDYAFDRCSSDLEISGYIGSMAQSYARKNNIKFNSIGEISATVLAEGNCGINGDNAKWTFTNDGVLTISGSGEIKENYISSPWNDYIKEINEIVIEAGITSMPDNLFWDCTSLISITVDDDNANYKSIDGVLFSKDGTKIIQYPRGNKQTSYIIPNGVTTIGDNAFNYCANLNSVTIPASVTKIDYYIFYECRNLSSIIADDNHANYKSIDGVLFSKDGTKLIQYPRGNKQTNYIIPEGVTTIVENAFYSCISLNSVTIPENVTTICNNAFSNSTDLISITVDDNNANYKSIDGVLFSKDGTKLIQYPAEKNQTSYAIPEGVTTIGERAFYLCENLSSITIPKSVVTISFRAFSSCRNLSSITIPESVTTIGNYAFSDCTGLSSITIPKGVTAIGDEAFAYCTSLSSVIVSEGVTAIGDEAFAYCTSLSSVTISEGVKAIGDEAFAYCTSLSSVTIPEGVTTIGNYTFGDCTSLSSVTIPASVTKIGSMVFNQCSSNLEISGYTRSLAESYAKENNIKFNSIGKMPSVILGEGNCGINGDNAKWTFTNDGVLTISGSGGIKDYSLTPWIDYKNNINEIVIDAGITSMPDNLFGSCESLISITVDDNNANYKSIDGALFSKDGTKIIQYPRGNKQTSYIIPDGVTAIGHYVFYNCPSLSSVTIPASVMAISDYSFSNCTSLISIKVDENNANYKSIDGVLFSKDGTRLTKYPSGNKQTSYNIPEGVMEIGDEAFYKCTNLSSIIIPESVTTIGNNAFANCTNLSSITIPKNLTIINFRAFAHCTGLSSVTISEGVMAIVDKAFYNCTSLSSITIPASVTTIGNDIFDQCSSDVEISGYTGSVAGVYAKENNIKFKSLGEMPNLPPLETNVVILDSFKDKVNVTKFEDNGSVKFETELLGGYDGDLTLYIAIYDSDGSLKRVEQVSANQEEDKLIWNIIKPDSKDLYKIMMWNNKNQPIIKAMK